MAYFNFKYAESKGLFLQDIILLQLINQLKTEADDLEKTVFEFKDSKAIENYIEKGWVFKIKGNKKDDDSKKLRLTKKGKELLQNIKTPLVNDGDVKMFDYLCKMYLDGEDPERIIGNKKQTKIYCTVFRKHMQLTLHEMYWLCLNFLENYTYTKKLENIFFDKNKHRYGTFEAHIEDSPLYQYFDENKKEVEQVWRNKITSKENG